MRLSGSGRARRSKFLGGDEERANQKAESMGIEVKSGWTKAEISAAIAAAAEA